MPKPIADRLVRCPWAGTYVGADAPEYIAYHDRQWGVPVHDDQRLFEFLVLQGAQAGLSWALILRKRPAYRIAFDGFDPSTVAAYGPTKVNALLTDAGIVRNRKKIESAITNARVLLEIAARCGSFDHYIWSFVEGRPLQNRWQQMTDVPAKTELSDRISKELKRQGMRFVGSTLCYAFMQAVRMVNDHLFDCFRQRELSRPGAGRIRR